MFATQSAHAEQSQLDLGILLFLPFDRRNKSGRHARLRSGFAIPIFARIWFRKFLDTVTFKKLLEMSGEDTDLRQNFPQ